MSPGLEFHGPLEWNVVFERGRTPWGHVLAFAAAAPDLWIVVDPHLRYTETYVLTQVQFDDWIVAVAATGPILRIMGQRRASLWPGPFCVGRIKHLLGIGGGAFSPRGLWRDLVRKGARQVFTREGQDPEGRPGGENRA